LLKKQAFESRKLHRARRAEAAAEFLAGVAPPSTTIGRLATADTMTSAQDSSFNSLVTDYLKGAKFT